jgi:hypothetical protein
MIVKKPAQSTKPTPQPAKFKGVNPPHSLNFPSPEDEPIKPKSPQTDEPTINLPPDIPVPEQPLKFDLPGPQWIEFDDSSLNETYRQQFLALLSNFTLTNLTQVTIQTLQIPNQPLSTYYQALWSLKGLPTFSSQLAQPLRE